MSLSASNQKTVDALLKIASWIIPLSVGEKKLSMLLLYDPRRDKSTKWIRCLPVEFHELVGSTSLRVMDDNQFQAELNRALLRSSALAEGEREATKIVRAHMEYMTDLLFDTIDDMLLAGEFGEVDELLREMPLQALVPELIVVLLSSTKAAAEHLPSRADLYRRSRERLELLCKDGNEETFVSELLDGLE